MDRSGGFGGSGDGEWVSGEWSVGQCFQKIISSSKLRFFSSSTLYLNTCIQGLTGRVFQLRVGSGSGIGKNYRVGSGLGLGSGIGIIY